MSTVTSSCLLLLLLCLSLHACNARLLGDKKPDEKSHFSTKDEIVAKVTPLASPKELEVLEKKAMSTRSDVSTRRLKATKKGGEKSVGAAMVGPEASLVSVSWKVPHKKRGEKQPGFNLDYSPPKTHPPSHN